MTACLSALSQRAGAVGTGGTALTTPLFSRVAGILIFIYKRAGSPAFITGDGSILWPGEMVDLDWKTRMEAPETNNLKQQSSKLFTDKIPPSYSQVFSPRAAPPAATRAYELYLRLPELSRLWTRRDFPLWKAEPVLKPALQGLEITFRLLSVVLSDPRPYCNQREWATRLESLAFRQVEIIAVLAEDEEAAAGAPVCGLMASEGILSRDRSSSSEVWKIPGATPVVNRTSDASLLARLATWERSEAAASKIQFQIEAQFRRCPFTLGVGEPNLDGKPNLEYDLVCRPAELHALKRTPFAGKGLKNPENKALYNVHQVLESWIFAGRRLVDRVGQRVEARRWNAAAADCWLLERVWKLLAEAEDLHMIMDPDDLLRLRSQLGVSENSGFCLRSASLMELIRASKDLRQLVPHVLGVEVDPDGGPRVQNAAMRLFHRRDAGEEEEAPRVHLLQGFQAVEAAVKRFFFDYRQLVAAVFGSLEASGASRRGGVLAQIFLEPPYFPSLDAAKTFVGVFWQQQLSSAPPETRRPGADDGGGLPRR